MKSKPWTPERIKALRKRKGLSQQAAAKLIGVVLRTWQNWEQGVIIPREPTQMLLTRLDTEETVA